MLQAYDPAWFEERLETTVVSLCFDEHACASAEGLATLDLTTRLLARFYPNLAFTSLSRSRRAGSVRTRLVELARTINPEIDVSREGGTTGIVVGRSRVPGLETAIYAGSDGWVARVSTRVPVGSGASRNPFGAGASACLAAANLFRSIFADHLKGAALDGERSLSLLDFTVGDNLPAGPAIDDIDLGLLRLVGLGAIGNGSLWALSRVHGLRGAVDLVDPEIVELSNLQRYAMCDQADLGKHKADHAAALVRRPELDARPFAMTWREYVSRLDDRRMERVAVALDTVRDRLEVQASLPKRLLNAWTQSGDLGVSRHDFLGPDACLCCLYLPRGATRNDDEIVAQELGFGEPDLQRIRAMLYSGEPVGSAFVAEVAGRTNAEAAALQPFANLPLRAFRAKAVCGGLVLRAADGGGAETEVPLAFQSAMAGIMLSAEIVADCAGLSSPTRATRTVVDLMRPLPDRINVPALKASRSTVPRCICQDADFIDAYTNKYAL
ncbi:E2 ligase fold family C protein [Enterovirga sp. CN4-39]|uniref:E2 ligase fold family C protein n=1 Tax=Enterovirga sp. CN4-39 TaxID=3400910 RepID=UPI003C030B1E